jgi:5-methyltetrahydropteroyltriglutamate--homocysteine methyltransferase
MSPATTARADVVGSLLRPQELLEARERYAAGEISAAEFKRVEDRAVDWAIGLQERAGLPVVTDGEMRRESFQSQMVEAVEGFGEHSIDAWLWGEWHGDEAVGDKITERPPTLGVVGELRRRRHLSVEEFVYVRGRTDRTVKVTLPSPSMYANLWSPELSREAYPTLDLFLEDVAEILREEVEELARLGAEYVQLDAPHYPLLLDARTREFYERRGWDLDRAGQPRYRGPPRRHLLFPPVPGQPGKPVARLRFLRAARAEDLRRHKRREVDAGVRRRA